MSSIAFDRPPPRVRVIPDNLESKIGYSGLLAARDALTVKVRGIGSFIASAQGSALRAARLLSHYLHLRRVGTLAATAASWTLSKAAVPLGLLRRVLTPAGALWALTTATGQRLTGTVLRTSLRFLESALMRGTDLSMVVLGKCGRIGRWAAGPVGNASALALSTPTGPTLAVSFGPTFEPASAPAGVLGGRVLGSAGAATPVGALAAGVAAEPLGAATLRVGKQPLDGRDDQPPAGLAVAADAGESLRTGRQSVTHSRPPQCCGGRGCARVGSWCCRSR